MAKKAEVKTNETSEDVVSQIKEHYGAEIVSNGQDFYDRYISTGIFELDLALGGGLKEDSPVMFSGKSGCGKTMFVLLLLAQFQKKYPELHGYWSDVESQFDTAFAEELGLRLDNTFHLTQGLVSAEDNVDTLVNYIESVDFGASVLDSVAAMVSTQQVEKSAGDVTVGGIGKPVKLLMNKIVGLVGKKRASNLPCLNILINRKVKGIGMFATSQFVGGESQQFNVSTILDIHRTGFNVAEIWGNKVQIDSTHEIKITKVRQRSNTGAIFTISQSVHSGFAVGQSISEADSIVSVLKHLKLWDSYSKTYVLTGEKFKKSTDFVQWLWDNEEERSFLRKLCIFANRIRVHKRVGIPEDNYLDGEFLTSDIQERLHSVYKEHIENLPIEISKKAVGKC